MKVADSTATVPIPERKPAATGSGTGNDSTTFGSVLAETTEDSPTVPLPGLKPARVLPSVKPEVPAAVLANAAPLPGNKPAAVLPGMKPDVPASLLADAQAQEAKGKPTTATLIAAEVKAGATATASTEERVKLASRQVAGLSGHSYAAIFAQANQESGLDVNSRSRNSTAAGPFQFLEKTWLGLFQRYGAAYGQGDLARQVEVHNGVPQVKDPAVRKKILDLRHDIDISAGMAARYLSEGRDRLQRNLGRPVTEAESRIAYVMGVGGASKLIRAASAGDATPAADLLPSAAKANGPLFYDRTTGRALSAQETVARLTRRMETEQRGLFAAIDKASAKPVVLDGTTDNPLGAFQSV